jgi:hypothetical protein
VTRIADAVASVVTRRTIKLALLATAILLPVIVIAAYGQVWASGPDPDPGEMVFFGPAGSAMLTGHWAGVFANPVVQAGPFELFPYGVLQLLGTHGTLQWTAYFTVCDCALTVVFVLGALSGIARAGGRKDLLLYVVAGGAALIGDFIPWAFGIGHPAQVVVPALWILAARAAKERHFATTGVLIGLSAGWEVWGVLGAPVIFCALRPDLLRAAWAGLATVAVTYGPFAASGHFRMFQFRWPISSSSLTHAIWPGMTAFPWSLRVVQAVLALAVGVAVAYASRRTVHALWLSPLAVLATRLTFDPTVYPYYWTAPAVVAVAAVCIALHERHWVLVGVGVVLLVWLWTPSSRTLPGAVVLVGVSAVCAFLALASSRRRVEVASA